MDKTSSTELTNVSVSSSGVPNTQSNEQNIQLISTDMLFSPPGDLNNNTNNNDNNNSNNDDDDGDKNMSTGQAEPESIRQINDNNIDDIAHNENTAISNNNNNNSNNNKYDDDNNNNNNNNNDDDDDIVILDDDEEDKPTDISITSITNPNPTIIATTDVNAKITPESELVALIEANTNTDTPSKIIFSETPMEDTYAADSKETTNQQNIDLSTISPQNASQMTDTNNEEPMQLSTSPLLTNQNINNNNNNNNNNDDVMDKENKNLTHSADTEMDDSLLGSRAKSKDIIDIDDNTDDIIIPNNIKWRQVPTTNGPIPRPRHGHRAVTIKEIIIIFGGGNEGIIDELNVLNTGTNQWFAPATRGEVPSGCAAFGFISDGVRLLVFGGMLEYGKYSNDLYELLASRWEWRKLTPLGNAPCPRLGHTFIMVDQKAIVFAGLANRADDPKMNIAKYLNDVYYFEVKEGTTLQWVKPEITGIPPCERESHSAITYYGSYGDEKKMIIYGGMNGKRLCDCYILDINSWTWIKPDLRGVKPHARSLHTASLIGNYMYVFGGWSPKLGCENEVPQSVSRMEEVWECSNKLSRLNLNTLRWEDIPYTTEDRENGLPKSRAGHCSAVVDTRIYIWSGRDGFNRGWNEQQVCCDDLWYLETAKPPPPSRVQLVRAGTTSLEVSWGYVSTADEYLLQIQLYQVKKTGETPVTETTASLGTPTSTQAPSEWFDVERVKRKTSLNVSKYNTSPLSPQIESGTDKTIELQVGTAYKFRVAAINSCGQGDFSDVTAFKTCLPGFPGAPSTIRITKVAEGAQLSWEPPAKSTGDILEYTVYLAVKTTSGTQSVNQLTFVRVYVGPKATCIVSQSHLTNAHIDLSSKAAILFRIAAKNDKGYGPATQVRWLQENAPKRPAPATNDEPKKVKTN